ncbi:hypothetical protein B4099_1067 [Heyndrickxia coagulans]|uniref:Uncharacterized protein n=1 Tax=Heyndrickxia coagulans TaxID=1398 RepID=A0A150KFQ7_HEYCO|nr:hypothetical protein B4099_1067 [Heyndrickxia coagulans]
MRPRGAPASSTIRPQGQGEGSGFLRDGPLKVSGRTFFAVLL